MAPFRKVQRLTWKQAAVGLYFTGTAYLRSSPSQALKQLLTIHIPDAAATAGRGVGGGGGGKNYHIYLCISCIRPRATGSLRWASPSPLQAYGEAR